MGDRWILRLRCAYCDKMNEDVYYAPSSGRVEFTCEFCKRENMIAESFMARKVKEGNSKEDK